MPLSVPRRRGSGCLYVVYILSLACITSSANSTLGPAPPAGRPRPHCVTSWQDEGWFPRIPRVGGWTLGRREHARFLGNVESSTACGTGPTGVPGLVTFATAGASSPAKSLDPVGRVEHYVSIVAMRVRRPGPTGRGDHGRPRTVNFVFSDSLPFCYGALSARAVVPVRTPKPGSRVERGVRKRWPTA